MYLKIVNTVLLGIILLLTSYYWICPYSSGEFLISLDRRLAGLEIQSARINGVNIRYLNSGDGEPIVFLHGLAADKDHWNQLSSFMNDDYSTYAPDLPGFGENLHPIYKDYSIQAQVNWLHEYTSKLGLDSFHLAGNSMGGTIAAIYAVCYPDQVKSLFLLAPAGVDTAKSELFKQVDAGKHNPLFIKDDGTFDRALEFLFYEVPYIPDAVITYQTENARTRREHYQAIFSDLYRYQKQVALDDVIEGLQVPTMVVWGKADRVLNSKGAEVLQETIVGSEVVLLKETGHLPMIERPEEVATMYRQFLSEVW